MLRLALVGKPQSYSYWYFQYFNSKDVDKLLGRKEEGRIRGGEGVVKMEVDGEAPEAEGEEEVSSSSSSSSRVENDIIISKIESMTGTRILVAPYEGGKGLKRCFLLMGEEELVAKARNHLQGAIAQQISPTGREVAALLAGEEGGREGGREADERLEEIRKELRDKHRLRMMEVQVSEKGGRGGREGGRVDREGGILFLFEHAHSLLLFLPH